ncbi:bifunctional glutamate N-acetyltransferase/amino-acid acetyltransferase ArgJ [Candidatus Solincola tengchongensis]|uniref:bifunctional glutamate N-acetyltransferase/amino-acid acetyltransferase ArgJ n=1 Tax=Candidatus Solincola tengchongensis TaxID=2900693 RepID=UPI002580A4FD|nr:bifunctional glutamate N-acetyltransferase/amino-acid acetyltransferase ArgJ [Candidatus Solincola tengchongensis]
MVFEEMEGGVCAPLGFKAAGVACGLKESGRPDLCLIYSEVQCSAAGVFTTNAFRAAPVLVSMEHLRGGSLRAVVANSGNANAWTGHRGLEDAREMAVAAARELEVAAEQVAVASTGVIGCYLDMGKLREGISRAASSLSREGASRAAEAIMTTDTFPKQWALEAEGFRVGGMAKGAGMISPRMATMLAFITTDAQVEAGELHHALRRVVDRTFNRITVDGCTSTNDMVVVMASGLSGRRVGGWEMEEALYPLCSRLARMIVEDGEGATRFITVRVRGAADDAEAEVAARAVADSPLVKTAFFGGDANWGRVVQALGASLPQLDPAGVEVRFGGLTVARGGAPVEVEKAALQEVMASPRVDLEIGLGRGEGEAVVWTCDLSYEYVRINAEYHT